MPHYHKIGEAKTGKDIPTGKGKHTHLFKGERVTSDPDGDQHTHATKEGEETSGPTEGSDSKKSLGEALEVREMTNEARARIKSK